MTDRLGRKNVCFMSLAAEVIIGFRTGFCKSIIFPILATRFATGFTIRVTTANYFLFLTESVEKKYCNIAGQMVLLSYPVV